MKFLFGQSYHIPTSRYLLLIYASELNSSSCEFAMDNLTNKVVVITGGGSGVGKCSAIQFLKHGAKVVIAGRNLEKLQAVADEVCEPTRLHTIVCDVSSSTSCAQLIDKSTSHFGQIDVLVNNAGTNIKARTFRELTPESWDQMIGTNLNGAYYCTAAVMNQMLLRKDGIIINLVSVAGKRANPLGGAAYVAAKFAMGALGTVIANEEKESGIRVSNIYPGEIDTPILEQRPKALEAEQRRHILKPDDVASAILFVAQLPKHVSIPELVIKPTTQAYF
jgi:NADP-dependent 3-hydroxy acid dehydrogenase YdfG